MKQDEVAQNRKRDGHTKVSSKYPEDQSYKSTNQVS
jgi:hypothetical protein